MEEAVKSRETWLSILALTLWLVHIIKLAKTRVQMWDCSLSNGKYLKE